MATLQTTTAPTVSASNITSPLAYNNGSLALIEYSGVISININSSVDLITNNSGYGRMTGYGYFVGATAAANPYGYFSFGVSRYGVLSTNLISLSSGNYSLSNFKTQIMWISILCDLLIITVQVHIHFHLLYRLL